MLTYPFIFIRPNQGDTASRPGRWPCEPAFESEPSRSAWWCSFVAPSHVMTKPAPTKCPCTEACRVHTRNEGIAEGGARCVRRRRQAGCCFHIGAANRFTGVVARIRVLSEVLSATVCGCCCMGG